MKHSLLVPHLEKTTVLDEAKRWDFVRTAAPQLQISGLTLQRLLRLVDDLWPWISLHGHFLSHYSTTTSHSCAEPVYPGPGALQIWTQDWPETRLLQPPPPQGVAALFDSVADQC